MQELWQYEPQMEEGYAQLNVSLVHGDERYDRIALEQELPDPYEDFSVFELPLEYPLYGNTASESDGPQHRINSPNSGLLLIMAGIG